MGDWSPRQGDGPDVEKENDLSSSSCQMKILVGKKRGPMSQYDKNLWSEVARQAAWLETSTLVKT